MAETRYSVIVLRPLLQDAWRSARSRIGWSALIVFGTGTFGYFVGDVPARLANGVIFGLGGLVVVFLIVLVWKLFERPKLIWEEDQKEKSVLRDQIRALAAQQREEFLEHNPQYRQFEVMWQLRYLIAEAKAETLPKIIIGELVESVEVRSFDGKVKSMLEVWNKSFLQSYEAIEFAESVNLGYKIGWLEKMLDSVSLTYERKMRGVSHEG